MSPRIVPPRTHRPEPGRNVLVRRVPFLAAVCTGERRRRPVFRQGASGNNAVRIMHDYRVDNVRLANPAAIVPQPHPPCLRVPASVQVFQQVIAVQMEWNAFRKDGPERAGRYFRADNITPSQTLQRVHLI